MSRERLLVLGEAAVDVVVDCGATQVSWGQAEHLVDDARLVLGSSGAITAVAAARLGLDVAFVGVVGDDPIGDFFLAELRADGVDVSAVRRVAGTRTGMTVVLQRAGDRALLTWPGTMADLTTTDVPVAAISRAGHVHVSSYFLQAGLQDGLAELLAAAAAGGAGTSVDPGWDPSGRWDDGLLNLLPGIDWLLPNRAEASRLAARGRGDVATDDGDQCGGGIEAWATQIFDALGEGTAVKLGASGALLRHAGRTTMLATEPVEPLDTTGAGDNFDAGFLAGLLWGREPAEALVLGAACGRVAVTGRGGTGRTATSAEALSLATELSSGLRQLPPL